MPAYRKKLIEVDLPLAAIKRESSGSKGHPATLHKWWSRKPLATCRAVIFASMVDDPSSCNDISVCVHTPTCADPDTCDYVFPDLESQQLERRRLHDLLSRLVIWKNSNDENLLHEARQEIAISVARSLPLPPPPPPRTNVKNLSRTELIDWLAQHAPSVYDPFCGGGSMPLEAQRLGLKAIGSDLNPVAVLINKALIEIPPKFANRPPANPAADKMGMTVGNGRRAKRVDWRGAAGLADDIRYYGQWVQERAYHRIGHLYPKANLPDGREADVIAWLWARTVPCPNPACSIKMPMTKTFQLSKKRGNQHWTKPIVDRETRSVRFVVQDHSDGVPSGATVDRNGARCIGCGNSVRLNYVREQARAGNIGEQMTAIVADGNPGRIFLSPIDIHIETARSAKPSRKPMQHLPAKAMSLRVENYGISYWHQLFTDRQLVALTTFSDLVREARTQILDDCGDEDYADAVCTYLALATGRAADYHSSYTRWRNDSNRIESFFGIQAILMIWGFAEANILADCSQNWSSRVKTVANVLENLTENINPGNAFQADASSAIYNSSLVIATDPPYYDNISHADLSDFFYVWLRPLLRDIYPDLFAGILTPKDEEAIASPRFKNPKERFERLLSQSMEQMRAGCSKEFPTSIIYAYKQQETKRNGKMSTGWETMLNSALGAGFQIVGTWPMQTEMSSRQNALGSNALASSIVLVCRPRMDGAPTATRSQFIAELDERLSKALDQLTHQGHIAPTDLAQSAIGPGMEVYSKYSRVIRTSGEPVPVREALIEINHAIERYFFEREAGAMDAESSFCVDWLRQHGYQEGAYGEAEVLSQAKNISIESLRDLHQVLNAQSGKVQLLTIDTFGAEREGSIAEMTAWEGCMRMAYHMDGEDGGGVEGCVEVYGMMGDRSESAERMARIMYQYHDARGEARKALPYNSVVEAWRDIQLQANSDEQGGLV